MIHEFLHKLKLDQNSEYWYVMSKIHACTGTILVQYCTAKETALHAFVQKLYMSVLNYSIPFASNT